MYPVDDATDQVVGVQVDRDGFPWSSAASLHGHASKRPPSPISRSHSRSRSRSRDRRSSIHGGDVDMLSSSSSYYGRDRDSALAPPTTPSLAGSSVSTASTSSFASSGGGSSSLVWPTLQPQPLSSASVMTSSPESCDPLPSSSHSASATILGRRRASTGTGLAGLTGLGIRGAGAEREREDLLHLAVRHDMVERKRFRGHGQGPGALGGSASLHAAPLSASLHAAPLPASLHRPTSFNAPSSASLGSYAAAIPPPSSAYQPPPAPITTTCSEPPATGPRCEKDRFVDGLIGTCELAIHSIWGASSSSSSSGAPGEEASTQVLPLRFFIRETLRRSRTSCSTLQLALYYLHRSRTPIRYRVARAERARRLFAIARARAMERETNALPTPPASPIDGRDDVADDREGDADLAACARDVLATSKDPIVCGRRMFLASLMLASKFLQDRNYSTRAWSKISGLPIVEINANERALLEVLDYDLFVRPELFDNWVLRLRKLASDHDTSSPTSPISPTRTNSTDSIMSMAHASNAASSHPLSPPLTPPQSSRHFPLSALGRASSQYSPAPSMQPSPRAGPPPALSGSRRFSFDAAAGALPLKTTLSSLNRSTSGYAGSTTAELLKLPTPQSSTTAAFWRTASSSRLSGLGTSCAGLGERSSLSMDVAPVR